MPDVYEVGLDQVTDWTTDRRLVVRAAREQVERAFKALFRLDGGSRDFLEHYKLLMGPSDLGFAAYVVEGVVAEDDLFDALDSGDGITPVKYTLVDYIAPETLEEEFGGDAESRTGDEPGWLGQQPGFALVFRMRKA